jgi:hypothetical protein
LTDSYYQKLDESDSRGERFGAARYVVGAWDLNVLNGAPVSALLVRALERCAPITTPVSRIRCGSTLSAVAEASRERVDDSVPRSYVTGASW